MEKIANPIEIQELTIEEKAILRKLYDRDIDYVSVGPKKYKLHRPYAAEAENIYNMPVRSSDIFVATYQRSGTTLTQELIWLLENNLDFVAARATSLLERYTFLELFMFYSKKWQESFLENATDRELKLKVLEQIGQPVTSTLLTAPSPRDIKTHLAMSLLPPSILDGKVVYVARDLRDVAVSCYHQSKLFQVFAFPKSFKEFWHLFVKDLFIYTPIFEHIKEAWALKDHPNMLFIFYEELIYNLPANIKRVADFLGREVTPDQIVQLCEHLSFDKFKQNDAVNFKSVRELGILSPHEEFIRKGKAGGWRDYFDTEMSLQAESWIAHNLRDTDLTFPTY